MRTCRTVCIIILTILLMLIVFPVLASATQGQYVCSLICPEKTDENSPAHVSYSPVPTSISTLAEAAPCSGDCPESRPPTSECCFVLCPPLNFVPLDNVIPAQLGTSLQNPAYLSRFIASSPQISSFWRIKTSQDIEGILKKPIGQVCCRSCLASEDPLPV